MADRKLVLVRLQELPDRTLGRLLGYDRNIEIGRWWSLELPDRNNARNISHIPAGVYKLTPEVSPKLGQVLRVHDVPGRDGILIHAGNVPENTKGCILAGMLLLDLNSDGYLDCARSRTAMTELYGWFDGDESSELVVVEAYGTKETNNA